MGVLHPLINKEDKTMKIDHRTRLAKVFRNPALKPYWKYVMYHHEMEFFIMHNRIEPLIARAGWNRQSIEDGLSLLESSAISGQQFVWRLYSEDEVKKDPQKNDALIMRFPVKEKTPFVVVCSGGAYSSVCNMTEVR